MLFKLLWSSWVRSVTFKLADCWLFILLTVTFILLSLCQYLRTVLLAVETKFVYEKVCFYVRLLFCFSLVFEGHLFRVQNLCFCLRPFWRYYPTMFYSIWNVFLRNNSKLLISAALSCNHSVKQNIWKDSIGVNW